MHPTKEGGREIGLFDFKACCARLLWRVKKGRYRRLNPHIPGVSLFCERREDMEWLKNFVDVFKTILEILGLLGASLAFIIAWLKKHNKRILWWSTAIGIGLVVLVIVVYIKITYYPGFVITAPRNGQIIISDPLAIEIVGIGARPGETITVMVSDGHTVYEQSRRGLASAKGNWVVENVILHTPGYKYSIWAEVERNGVKISTDNRVEVSRVDSNHRFNAIVHNYYIYVILLVLFVVVGISFYIAVFKRK